MVDADRLADLLSRVTARMAVLDEYALADHEALLGDRRSLNDCKYTFQTAIEACIDAAHHVVASEGLGRPATNGAAFTLLADADLIDAALAERMVGAVGFRNVLVHGYAEVDDRRVLARLDDRHDLTAVVRALTTLL